jgi:flagellar hook-associated protein 1 FlgK
MSLNAIFGAGVSGLQTAQAQLRAISDNIANIDTPGYVRKIVDQEPLVAGGVAGGVQVAQIRLAADKFLQAAGLNATSDAATASAKAGIWDQVQSLFGDPTKGGFFGELDSAFSSFATLAANPSSTAAASTAVDKLGQFFSDANSISGQIDGFATQANSRISANIDTANKLMSQIDSLNLAIVRAKVSGGDATGSESQQAQMIDQLSSLIDIKVQARDQGGVILRTGDGLVLSGEGPSKLSYDSSGPVGQLLLVGASGSTSNITARVSSGEIKGLLDLRNTELPTLKNQLAEMVSGTADAINAIHNASSASPPPTSLAGRATGQDIATAITGFTGKSTISVMNAAGMVQQKVDIDFSAGTMSANGGPATPFTAANFVTDLNTALGGAATASYSASGALTLTGASGNGVAVADPATGGSAKVGKGFSQFFGLNDLVTSSVATDYATGLQPTDPHGFTAGGTAQFQVAGPDGAALTTVSFTVPSPPATTMSGLITALNQAPPAGVGGYGSFALSAKGELAFTSTSGNTLSVINDHTTRSDGLSLSQAFGIGDAARGDRAGSFSIRSDIAANPANLAMGRLDITAAVGTRGLSAGDARGADALAQAGLAQHSFAAVGEMRAITQSLSDYAASFSGLIGRKAQAADDDQTKSQAVATEAAGRRSSVEGVNLDQELVNLTTYQQAYNASARVIQAAKDMYDVLLNMM